MCVCITLGMNVSGPNRGRLLVHYLSAFLRETEQQDNTNTKTNTFQATENNWSASDGRDVLIVASYLIYTHILMPLMSHTSLVVDCF